MEITNKTVDDVTVVTLKGDIDAKSAPEVQAEVLSFAQPGTKLLLDMTEVPFMSSAGLRMLLSVYRKLSATEGKLVLAGVAEGIVDTMSVTGFLQFFPLAGDVESGLTLLK